MKRLKNLVAIAFLFISVAAFSQRDVESNSSLKDRLYFGGGGGFNGGTNSYGSKYFYFSVSPIVGYMVSSQFSVGSGVVYQRTSYPDFHFNYTQYGLMPFARYNFNELFLTTEFNYINLPIIKATSNGYLESDRVFRSRMLFGAGYSKPLGSGRSRINAMALYDVLYRKPSVFLSPWVFRVFISF